MKNFFLVIILISSLSYAAKSPVLAVVNGISITKDEFLKTYRQNKLFVSNKVVTKAKVLNDLLAKKAGVQKAKKAKLDKDPVVAEKMEDVLYHAQISKDLEPELKKIKVSDLDVKEYYNKNKEYRTAQILLRTKANASPKELNDALKVAQDIYSKVKSNPNQFGEFANKYSQTSNAKTGGDMGFQPPNRYAPEYFSAIRGREIGYITPPTKSQFGFHIVKILAVKDFKNINLGLYKKIIYDQKRNVILENYFKKLIRSAKVKINKDVLKTINE